MIRRILIRIRVRRVRTPAKVMVTNLGENEGKTSFNLANQLRKNGILTELVYDPSKLGKQLKKANELGVEIAIIVGSEEIGKGQVTIKNLSSGQQETVYEKDLLDFVNQNLNKS